MSVVRSDRFLSNVRFGLFIIGSSLLSFLICHLFFNYLPEIDYINLVINGILALITVYLIYVFYLNPLKKSGYRLLVIGLMIVYLTLVFSICLAIFLVPELLEGVIRGVCFFSGYLLVVLGMKKWLDYTTAFEQKLIQQNNSDEHTGLLNRRAFIRAAQRITHEDSGVEECTFALLDIDEFKKINDKFGHSSADQVLLEFTSFLKRQYQKDAYIGRWGGDQFAILLLNISALDAEDVFKGLIEELKRHIFDYQNHQIKLTISIGLGDVIIEESFVANTLRKIEKALRQAKKMGQGQIVVAELS
ncbi:GGDEF domain-containing protein [Marinicella sp. W31]|uniref:GGDEF domain-containing protein n=1 Tax=Marinicella sp. W31 TaxID=3023713 RepID=UPI003757A879